MPAPVILQIKIDSQGQQPGAPGTQVQGSGSGPPGPSGPGGGGGIGPGGGGGGSHLTGTERGVNRPLGTFLLASGIAPGLGGAMVFGTPGVVAAVAAVTALRALAAAAMGAASNMNSFAESVREVSGPVSVAFAEQEVLSLQQRIRLGQQTDMVPFIRAQGELQRAITELNATFLSEIAPLMTGGVNILTLLIENADEFAAWVRGWLPLVSTNWAYMLEAILLLIDILRQQQPPQSADMNNQLRDFFSVSTQQAALRRNFPEVARDL